MEAENSEFRFQIILYYKIAFQKTEYFQIIYCKHGYFLTIISYAHFINQALIFNNVILNHEQLIIGNLGFKKYDTQKKIELQNCFRKLCNNKL